MIFPLSVVAPTKGHVSHLKRGALCLKGANCMDECPDDIAVIQELNKSQLTIVLFDLDGTLTRRDTFTDFIQYAVGKPKYYRGLLNMSPALTGYALRLISNHIAKEKLLSYYFKGWEISRFQQIADSYSAERIDELSRPLAVERIRWH